MFYEGSPSKRKSILGYIQEISFFFGRKVVWLKFRIVHENRGKEPKFNLKRGKFCDILIKKLYAEFPNLFQCNFIVITSFLEWTIWPLCKRIESSPEVIPNTLKLCMEKRIHKCCICSRRNWFTCLWERCSSILFSAILLLCFFFFLFACRLQNKIN